MDEPVLICNQAYCHDCGTLVISHSRHDFNSCLCGGVSVDGGNDYARRVLKSRECYEDRSIYSDAPFEVIRENLYRGSRGKDGLQPLKWVKISEIDDEYLEALIVYCAERDQFDSIYYKFYLQEREYRLNNTQKCKEV